MTTIKKIAAYIAIGAPYIFVRDALLYWGVNTLIAWIGAAAICVALVLLRDWGGKSNCEPCHALLDTRQIMPDTVPCTGRRLSRKLAA